MSFLYDAVGKLAPSTPSPKRSHAPSVRRGAGYSTVVADEEDAKVAYLTSDHLGDQAFDVKSQVGNANEGRLLNGQYATARSAGNYLAGVLGATGTLGTISISENTMLRLAGALHRGQLTDGNAFRTILFGTEFGREIPHAERQILRGFRDGVRSEERRNFSPPRW